MTLYDNYTERNTMQAKSFPLAQFSQGVIQYPIPMPARVVSHRLPDSLLTRIDSLSKKTGLKQTDIVRMALMRALDIAETDPGALLRFEPQLKAMDGRTKESALTRVAELDSSEPVPVQSTAKKKVDYRQALKEDRKKALKKPVK